MNDLRQALITWDLASNPILTDRESDAIVEAARKYANLDAALRVLSIDMHQASPRPCLTCSDLTAVLGWPFGCVARSVTEDE